MGKMGKQKKKNLVERNTITRLLSSLFGDCDAQTCRLRRLLSLATHHLGAIAGTLLEKLSQRRKPRNNSEKNKGVSRLFRINPWRAAPAARFASGDAPPPLPRAH